MNAQEFFQQLTSRKELFGAFELLSSPTAVNRMPINNRTHKNMLCSCRIQLVVVFPCAYLHDWATCILKTFMYVTDYGLLDMG